jgi:Holliday junction resolvase RusA-like endonuclease
MKLTLLNLPPSANQYQRSHWAVKRKLRNMFGQNVRMETRLVNPMAEVKGKRRVKISIYRPRRLDFDNAVGGCKPLVDSLRDIGLIKNDSPRWLDLEVEQFIDRKNPRVEIEITEAT